VLETGDLSVRIDAISGLSVLPDNETAAINDRSVDINPATVRVAIANGCPARGFVDAVERTATIA
jgi:hypothetical protein